MTLHPFLAQLHQLGVYNPHQHAPRQPPVVGGTLPAVNDPVARNWASSALIDEANQVAATPEGARNHALNRAGYKMGQIVALGYIDEFTVRLALEQAAHAAGLGRDETTRTLSSGLAAGRAEPRATVVLNGGAIEPAYTLDVDPWDRRTPPGTSMNADGVPAGRSTNASMNAVNVGPDESAAATALHSRLVPGGVFIHSAPDAVPALWGHGDDVLWAEGEPLLITGPTGVGKTTLGGMVVAGRLGLIDEVIGLPVVAGHKRTLVLAMDRPAQIQRALARLLRAWPASQLDEKLIVWKGPPPADIARHPEALLWLATQAEADTVVIDSLKDAAVKLSDEETGQGISRAMNLCVASGVEVLAYHHQTKRGAGGLGKPNSLADVYGSGWITAGVGSVLLLWGAAGDLVVELSHLKQPASEVGPLDLVHDHYAGRTSLYRDAERLDELSLLSTGPQTASGIASMIYGAEKAGHKEVVKVRRRLDRLVRDGIAVKLDEAVRGGTTAGQKGGSQGARYALVTLPSVTISMNTTTNAGPVSAGQARSSIENESDDARSTISMNASDVSAGQSTNASTNSMNAASTNAHPPLFRGGETSFVVRRCERCERATEQLHTLTHGRYRELCSECAYPIPSTRPGAEHEEDS